MKAVKKLISAVCALSMLSTVLVQAAWVQYEDIAVKPTLKITQKTYDESTREGEFSISIVDADKAVPAGTVADDYIIKGIQIALKMDSESFDVSYYKKAGRDNPVTTNVTIDERLKAKAQSPAANADGDIINLIYGDISADTALCSYGGDDMSNIHVADVKFKLLDGVSTADVAEVYGEQDYYVVIETGVFNSDYLTFAKTWKWGTADGTTSEMNYDFETLGKEAATPTPTATATAEPVVTPEPTPVAPTPTPVVTPEPTPVAPTEGNGAITTEQSGSENDAAVWAWKELTGNGNAVTVTIDTGAVNAAVKSKTFTLGADVEGVAKVGIVIQYDPTVFTSGVSVTSMSLATAN